ncbi:MAG: hypothetical protein HY202_05100, partial [Nitrospirae bacterium]|nr:hypothetical protein [Nitrospirota bacterium]
MSATKKNDIYAMEVSYTTTITTNVAGTAIATTNNIEQFPSAATNGTSAANNFYVAYYNGTNVQAIPVSVTSTTITPGTTFTVNAATANAAAPSVLPQILYSNSTANNYLVVWEDFGTDTAGNVYGKTFLQGSTTTSALLGIAVTASTPERYPKIAFDGTNFLTAYQRGATGGSADVFAQFVTTSATTSGSNFTVSGVSGSDQTQPAVAYNSTDGIYLFTWTDARTSTTNTDIYGARVGTATSGNVLDSSGLLISNQGGSPKPNSALSAGGPNYYVAWTDATASNNKIYGQLVGPPQINSVTPFSSNTVEARNPLTINSTLYGTNGTFGPDPVSRSTTTDNVVIGGYQIGTADFNSWSLTTGVNSTIGILAPYATAVSGGTGVGTATVTRFGWASAPSANLTIQDYSLSVSPSSTSVTQGSSASYTVTMATTNGFASTVTLSMSLTGPCPSGATCSFFPASIQGNGSTSTLTVATTTSTPGATYSLIVQGTGGSNNQLVHTASTSLTVSSPPTVTTGSANSITQTAATLNGSVNPNGLATTAWFEYGLSTTYSSSTTTVSLTAGTTPVAVSANISGLSINTLYHFRVDATNSSGTSYGTDATFTTLANKPTVTTLAATVIGSTTSTLNGSVNTGGTTANGWFEYGLSTSYGTTTASQAL